MDLILTHEGSRTKCSARTATKLTVVARNVSGWPVCMIFHVSISDPSPWSLKIPTYIWVIAIAPKMMVGDWSLLLPRRSQLMFRALGPSRALGLVWGGGAKARGNIAQIRESK